MKSVHIPWNETLAITHSDEWKKLPWCDDIPSDMVLKDDGKAKTRKRKKKSDKEMGWECKAYGVLLYYPSTNVDFLFGVNMHAQRLHCLITLIKNKQVVSS